MAQQITPEPTTETTYEIQALHFMYGEYQWVRVSDGFAEQGEAERIADSMGSYTTQVVKVVTTRTPVPRAAKTFELN